MQPRPSVQPESAQLAELRSFGAKLRACSPPRAAHVDHPEQRILTIERRSRAITRRRRTTATAALVLLALGVGLTVHRLSGDRDARTVADGTHRRPRRLESRRDRPMLADLGSGVGRVLLRPGSRASYDATARVLHLDSGAIVAHVLPDGRGFRVELAQQTVVVKGTLFGVDATRGTVHVWHGVVEHRDRRPAPGNHQRTVVRVIRGTETYDDLSAELMGQLGFTPPTGPVASGHTQAPAAEPPAAEAPAARNRRRG